MEFGEKLQLLRKNKGITQEELAEKLFVSRTAVSKWESGRGYPNIDSLKEISKFFSVSIDDLLSVENVLFIAEKENKDNIRKLYDMTSGIVDIFSLLLIALPLYPNEIEGYFYSVNLIDYIQASQAFLKIYWILYIFMFLSGIAKLVSIKAKAEKFKKIISLISVILNIITVIFLALSREVYAVVIAFLILVIKAAVILRITKL